MAVDTTNIKVPASCGKRVLRMIEREKHKTAFEKIPNYMKKAVAAVLIICTAAFTLAMSVKAVREALWSTIVEWYKDYIAVSYVVDETPPTTIEEKKEPSTIPDDWVREVKLDTQSMYLIEYTKNDEFILEYSQTILDGNNELYDNRNINIDSITIHENIGSIITLTDKGLCCLIWNDGCYSYLMSYDNSKINLDTVIDIAESIK